MFFTNRWHPDIPAAAKVQPGETFRVECIDWTGGQIKNNDNAREVNLNKVHYLSGPISVEGAEPGDILEVEILDVQRLPGDEWGYTGIFVINNGGGFLCDKFKKAHKAIWDFDGVYAISPHPRRTI